MGLGQMHGQRAKGRCAAEFGAGVPENGKGQELKSQKSALVLPGIPLPVDC